MSRIKHLFLTHKVESDQPAHLHKYNSILMSLHREQFPLERLGDSFHDRWSQVANKTCWSLYSRKSPFHTNRPFFKQHHLWVSGSNHVHTRMALIVYFRLESCLLADKISTNQNRDITVLLSFHFIALVYVPLATTNTTTEQCLYNCDFYMPRNYLRFNFTAEMLSAYIVATATLCRVGFLIPDF